MHHPSKNQLISLIFLVFIVALAPRVFSAELLADDTDGFASIFDGKSLKGWRVIPAEQSDSWTVRKGMLIGKTDGAGSELIWKDDDLGDFELKLRYRLRTEGNSGIHIRGRLGQAKTHRVKGYHADFGHVGIGPNVLGAWDFHGAPRGSHLVTRGNRVVIDEQAEKQVMKLKNALTEADVRRRDWNEVHVVVRGERLYFTINGKMASEVIDREASQRINRGVIGLQLHSGEPMTIEFKDLQLKRLPTEGFRPLFNGTDLTGWYGNNPHATAKAPAEKQWQAIVDQQEEFHAHWRAEDQELVNDGHGPYATTADEYGDIELLIDYKTVAKADSGIYLRGTPQVQIWDFTKEGGKWDRGADKGSGGLYNNRGVGKHPLVLADKPFGQWNGFRILQIGSRTTVYLNDKLVVDNVAMENYWDKDRITPLPRRGPIHLQTHGGEIRWKNLQVREIGADEANRRLRGDDAAAGFTPIFNGKDLAGWTGAADNYEVREASIVCKEGQGGVLFTEEEYEDFVVRLEFKLPPGGNNGLAIRYPGTGRASRDAMCELQVLDDTAEKYAKLDPRQFHGSAYGMAAPHRGYLRPVGHWNYQEVTVKGSTIKVELNGVVILNADLSTVTEFKGDDPHPGKDLKKGHFGFAGHRDPVMFRNIAIKRL